MKISKYLDYIGFFGPVILFITTIFLLLHKQVFLWGYIIANIINIIFNIILKNLIKDPRPEQDPRLFKSAIENGKHLSIDKYGMPSGHSQSVGFSCTFIYFALYNFYYFLGYFIISIITMLQRFNSKNHTISQIIVGFLLGSLLGYISISICREYLKGKLREKKDDDCYI
jgi:dolichyldiphosphatase